MPHLRCAIVLVLIALVGAAGCVWEDPIRIELPGGVKRPDTCVALCFADGVNLDTLRRMMAAGQLPNIRQHLFDRGTQVDSAVTVVPSITFAVNVTLATGQLPGHHGVMANRWFDRDRLQLRGYIGILDYLHVDDDFVAPTLFEMAPDLYSVTVLNPVHRGSTRHFADWLSTGVTWFFASPEQVDALTAYRMNQIGQEAGQLGRWPDLLWLYFSAPDHVGHQFGRDSPQYESILRNLDVQIGRVVAALQQAGVYDRTLLVLVSDHGHVPVDPGKCVDLVARLNDLGFTVGHKELTGGTYLERLKVFGPDRVVVLDDGNRRAALHLRATENWSDRPTLEQIERFARDYGGPSVRAAPRPFWDVLLSDLPAGRLAAVRDGDNRVLITDGVGRAVVARQIRDDTGGSPGTSLPLGGGSGRGAAGAGDGPAHTRLYRYQVTQSPDPLGLTANLDAAKLLDGQFHSSGQWLEATCQGTAPDMVAQIVEYFDSRRSGDLVIFSMGGWQFARPTRGGHGSVAPDDMHVPMVFAGPGIPAGGHIHTARIVDVAPTVLDYLGRLNRRSHAVPLDGVSRLDQLRAATTQPG